MIPASKNRLAAIAALLLASGCATFESRVRDRIAPPPMAYAEPAEPAAPSREGAMPRLPAASARAEEAARSAQPAGTAIHALQIERELVETYALSPRQIEFSDRRYNLPSQAWIETRFIPYFLRYAQAQGLAPVGEGMDCDNIARLFREFLALSNHQGGRAREGDVPCAVAKVRQAQPFGGVGGDDSYHSLVILRSEAGWLAIEPQTGALSPLADYPNLATIDWLLF